MKRLGILLMAIVFLTILSAQTKTESKNITWNSFDKGLAEAKKSNKKVLVDIWTEWCKWCKEMDKKTYSDKRIQEYLRKNFVLVKLNPETDGTVTYDGKKYPAAEFSQGMGIESYPSTLFLQSNGKPITILPGYSEADMFIHVLSFIKEEQYQKKKFSDYLTEKGIKQ